MDIDKIFKKLKCGPTKYKETLHCKLLLEIMSDPNKGRISAFCKEVLISEPTFYKWVKTHELFAQCYSLGQIFARESWEKDGFELRDRFTPPGTIDHGFEYWKMIGWSRFGISKNSRIKLDLNPDDNPSQHYSQLLKQASTGAFTAAEIKQLMEAVNVGLNTHQVFELQKQIDELKSDMSTMNENSNVQNSFTNKGIAQKD
jgi:hypothetical protein